jgi:hypothetical protein
MEISVAVPHVDKFIPLVQLVKSASEHLKLTLFELPEAIRISEVNRHQKSMNHDFLK